MKYSLFISFLGITLIAIFYWIYSGQLVIGVSFIIFAIIGYALTSLLNRKIATNVYAIFFIIYGVLLLISQYIFIDDIPFGYFNHKDAAFSFYDTAVIRLGPKDWETLVNGTLFKSFYGDYPLFAFWINLWKLAGYDIGVSIENLRLFLRLQDLLFAPMLLAVMAKYFKEIGMDNKHATTYCYVFGFCSYLFLTSVVFSRDLHVAFFYTLAGYYCISPYRHRFVYLKLFIIALICFGLRPENGMFAVIFPIYYLFRNTPPNTKLLFGALTAVVIVVFSGFIDSFIANQESYNIKTMNAISQSGMYAMFNSLPFPLNYIFNIAYSFIMPFPLTMYVVDDHIGWLGLSSIIIPFVNVVMLCSLIVYFRHHRRNYRYLWFFFVCIIYVAMCCSIEPNVRRAFAIIPSMFMLFAAVKPFLPRTKYRNIVSYSTFILLLLNIPAILYLYLKGNFS